MKIMLRIIACLFAFICATSLHATDLKSPIGYWKTIDDETGKPKSIVQIFEAPDHTLQGRVLHIYPKPGEDQNKVCDKCSGARHNQRIVGMIILEGMKEDEDEWDGGEILDPHNGKTYRCTMKVSEDGLKLMVHGYIGIPLFGRSQTWLRVDKL